MKPLNIVYINSHDTGRYIQPYGYAVPTPRLQKFAEQSVLFRHAFTNNPTCSPSRACLATGQYAHTNGMLGLAHRGGKLNDPSHTLAHHLNDHGYETALAGFQHIYRPDPDSDAPLVPLGFNHDLSDVQQKAAKADPDRPYINDWSSVEAAKHFLNLRDADKPFYLEVGFSTTHRSGLTDEGVQWHNASLSPTGDPRYVRGPACLPDTPETRRDFADFMVAAARLDDLMGDVIDAIDAAGLAESTLVLVTTDHGIAYPRMKCNLTDHGTGVMVMLRGPGGTPLQPGTVIEPLVQQIDLFPTLCDLAGLDTPDRVQGKSWQPLLKGEVHHVHDAIFTEVNNHAAFEPKRSVRTDRYRYSRRYGAADRIPLANTDPSVTKQQWAEDGGPVYDIAEESLYDLHLDPNEAHDRIDDPALASVKAELANKLDRWMRDTEDPMLGDPTAIRQGFMLNETDEPTDPPVQH